MKRLHSLEVAVVYKLKKVDETASVTELKLERYSGLAPTYKNMRN